ncbi:hypothetical protein SGCZBJ_12575 [Caulobacter zeae]|uniref:Phage tail protein n=1 Tax=Caulobacter zeae TaxID=2055137 RepID=A0A2N5DG81_9CAUL|nr:phage tail tube protein [Caulobacter zeae]PLR25065.1 hypothetical protein SGCZBJ_12575 [Caulobacter zeae]
MAGVKHARGVKLVLKVSAGGNPETFEGICSINAERELTFEAATNDFNLPDCTDTDLLSWLVREKVSLSSAFTGAGILNLPDLPRMWTWLKSPDPVKCQIIMDVPAADGGVLWEGFYHLSNFSVTGNVGEKAQTSMTLASDGEITMTVIQAGS